MAGGGITINGRRVGPGQPVYIVAEVSANHSGSLERARQIVRAAAAAGADAVKLQTYTPDTLTVRPAGGGFRIKDTPWDGQDLYALYEQAQTPWEWYPDLAAEAASLGLDLFSTPFDRTAVDFLEQFSPPCHKIASFENVDYELLRAVGATGRPVIMSTGMASAGEIADAVATLREAGCTELALLKCTSAYPSPPETMNLATIPDLAARFGVVVGLSDHSLDVAVPVTAVALGACLIEKHLTISRATPTPDSAFSLEPDEFAAMVSAVRVASAAIGRVSYGRTAVEEASAVFRRSLFVVRDVAVGDVLTGADVQAKRPGIGLHPRWLPMVTGRRVTRAVPAGTPVSWDLVEGGAPSSGQGEAAAEQDEHEG